MTPTWQRWLWLTLKIALAAVILAFVGRQFWLDLTRPELAEVRLRPGWLFVSGLLYLLALTLFALFWFRLLVHCGQQPALLVTLRAYFLGQMGKYVPGKAWALLLRGGLVRGPQVRLGVAMYTSFYEVLTTMVGGALVAVFVFLVQPPVETILGWPPSLVGLIVLVLCAAPLAPPVFNFLVDQLTKRLPTTESVVVPSLGVRQLAEGLLLVLCAWCLLGLSVWAILEATLPTPPELSLASWAHVTASMGLAYVAGFLAVFLPSGVGVREYVLLTLLAFAGPEPIVAAAVLLLRLAWTGAELVVCAIAGVTMGKERLVK